MVWLAPKRRPGRRVYQRGSVVLPVAAWSMMASIVWAGFCFFEGLASVERVRTQARADAMALGAAVASRVYGPNFRCELNHGGPFIERLHELNGGTPDDAVCPDMEERVHGELSEAHSFSMAGVGDLEGELLAFEMDQQVNRDGRALRIFQLGANYEDFFYEYPNIELVLDFSRSMDDEVLGINKLQRLREAVSIFFTDIERRFRVGLIIFASDIMSVRRIDDFTDAHINSIENAVYTTDVGRTAETGMTNYQAALRLARQELNNDGSPFKNIIFISDGRPTEPSPREVAAQLAIAEGAQLRAEGVEVFGLFIGLDEDATVMEQIVTEPDPEHLVVANDTDAIHDFFAGFEVYYLCRLPIHDTWDDTFPPAHTSAWLRSDDDSPGVPLVYVDDDATLLEPEVNLTFSYTIMMAPDPINEFSVYVTKAACEWLEENEDRRFVLGLGHSMLASADTPL